MVKPYGPNFNIEKVECTNHVLRNYCNKLTDLSKKAKSGFPVSARQFVQSNKLRFRMAVTRAVAFRSSQQALPLHERIRLLKADIENGPYHIFGHHKNCARYFCPGEKEGEVDQVPELTASNFMQEVVGIVRRSVSQHASSLIHEKTNNPAEQFNAMVNKFVGGKRVNFALRDQYQVRCNAAAVAYNNVGEYLRMVHKAMMDGNSPGRNSKSTLLHRVKLTEICLYLRIVIDYIQVSTRKNLYRN